MTVAKRTEIIAGVLVAALAASYIGYDVLRGSHKNWPGWWEAVTGQGQAPALDSILNYSSFHMEAFGDLHVVTGTKYDDSTRRNIIKQWCYLERENRVAGDLLFQIDLARTKDGALKIHQHFTPRAQAHFDLSDAQLRALTTSHCKFN